MYSCPNFDFLLPLDISSASSSLITKNVSTTTPITCVPNTQSRKYLQQPILPLCGIVYSKRLLRNEELFPLSLAFLKRRDRGIGRLTDGRLVTATVGKNIPKKCYKLSLLDNAPNYLLSKRDTYLEKYIEPCGMCRAVNFDGSSQQSHDEHL